jgi:transposase
VLTLPPSVRIFLALEPADMRKSFDGLCALARDVLALDPFGGHLFGFANRRRDMIKVLVWDRSGFALYAKRLEKGTFAWPEPSGAASVEMTSRELMALLEGLDASSGTWRRRYERPAAAARGGLL